YSSVHVEFTELQLGVDRKFHRRSAVKETNSNLRFARAKAACPAARRFDCERAGFDGGCEKPIQHAHTYPFRSPSLSKESREIKGSSWAESPHTSGVWVNFSAGHFGHDCLGRPRSKASDD